MDLKKHNLILIILAVLCGCEERFDFTADRSEASLFVIDGFIDQSSGPHQVLIAQTRSAGAQTPIINAQVYLEDQFGNRFEMEEDEQGIYKTERGAIAGISGQAYRIEASLASGELFQSAWDTLPRYKTTDTITWGEYLKPFTSDLGGDFTLPVVSVNLETEFDQLSEPIFTVWRGEETYQFLMTDFPDPFGAIPPPCYIIQQFGTEQINLFSNLGRTDRRLNIEEFFWREIDDSFLRKHIFSIYQFSISAQYFEYLRAIETLVENSGSLFDNPPGQAIGNVRAVSGTEDDVLGYFSAVLSDTSRIAVYPSQLDTYIIDDCLYTAGKFRPEYDQLCLNCLLIPRSSYNRPGYWTDF